MMPRRLPKGMAYCPVCFRFASVEAIKALWFDLDCPGDVHGPCQAKMSEYSDRPEMYAADLAKLEQKP